MTTKHYLEQIERFDKMIQRKLSEMEYLMNMTTSVTSTMKEINVQISSDRDRIGNAVTKLIDLKNETSKFIDDCMTERKHIINQIDGIKDTNMYYVLSGKYIMRKDLTAIAVEMGYSLKQIKRIHGNALLEFEKVYGKEYLEDK